MKIKKIYCSLIGLILLVLCPVWVFACTISGNLVNLNANTSYVGCNIQANILFLANNVNLTNANVHSTVITARIWNKCAHWVNDGFGECYCNMPERTAQDPIVKFGGATIEVTSSVFKEDFYKGVKSLQVVVYRDEPVYTGPYDPPPALKCNV